MTDTPPPKSFGLLFRMADKRVAAKLLMLLLDLSNTLILRNENHNRQVDEKILRPYSLNKNKLQRCCLMRVQKRNIQKSKALAVLLAFPLLLSSLPLSAEITPEPDNLEAVLEGFEEEAEQAPAEDLNAVLEGFDNDEAESASGQPADDDLDAVLDGFGTEEKQSAAQRAEADAVPAAHSRFNLDGWLQFGTAYNFSHESAQNDATDWRGFSRSRIDLQLDLTARISDSWSAKIGAKGFYDALYSLEGRDEYSQEVLDDYEDELELREVYVQGQLTEKLDLKMGRQVVVWGKSDNIRVTDVLNPLDMREPGMTDIEDLRLPVSMTKLDYYFGDWELSGIAVHELRFNKVPAFGHDFYPADEPMPPADEPENSLENTEWALSLSGIFSGWDFDLYYARIFNDSPHLEYVLLDDDSAEIRQKHERLNMFGFAYNKALGNWLLKSEGAVLNRVKYSNRPGTGYTRFDLLVGVEYSGFAETSISLEFADRHINNHKVELEAAPDGVVQDMYQLAFRYNRDFLNDTLSLSLLAVLYGPSSADGAFERLSLDYDLTDTIMLRSGAVLYQSGDLFNMQEIGDNDRLFAEIRYSF